jgi:hypothetical protein
MEAQKESTTQEKQSDSNDPKEPPSASTAEIGQHQAGPPANGGDQGGGNRRPPKEVPPPNPWYAGLNWTDWITAISALITALATVVIMIWAGLQWYEMHTGGADTTKIANAADQIKTYAGSVKDSAKQFSDSAGEIDTKIGTAETDFANMATNSANAIKATQEQMRLDQRPWAYVFSYSLSEEPEAGKPITVKIGVLNSGKTPAVNLGVMTHPSCWDRETPEPDWTTVANDLSHAMVPPQATGFSVTTSPLTLANCLDAYNSGQAAIYVRAKIVYDDTFGQPHWTTVCILHHHGRPLNEFDLCKTGNDVDRTPTAKTKPQKPN